VGEPAWQLIVQGSGACVAQWALATFCLLQQHIQRMISVFLLVQ
jgi:hypothetical protein